MKYSLEEIKKHVAFWSVVAWVVALINISIAAPYEFIVKGPLDVTGFPAVVSEGLILIIWPWFYHRTIYKKKTPGSPKIKKILHFMLATHLFAMGMVIVDMPLQVYGDMTRPIVQANPYLQVIGYADIICNAYLSVCLGRLAYFSNLYRKTETFD